MQHIPASADLQGITELTLIIPVKPGFVGAVGTLTYASRLRALLGLLGGLRKNSQDVQRFKLFSDTVERIQFIHGFRLNLLGNTQLLLEVAFDGAWEPYLRSIWRDLGPLLDVIMCNCKDYPISVNCTFAEYERWIRERQVPANFFYIDSAATVSDVFYLRKAERLQREIHDPQQREASLATLRVPDVLTDAVDIAQRNTGELMRQGLMALDAVHQLRVFYNSSNGATTAISDDTVLLRATHMLLKELKDWDTRKIPAALRCLYATPLAWFEQELVSRAKPVCPYAASSSVTAPVKMEPNKIQGGIVDGYHGVQSGCLLLLKIEDMVKAKAGLVRLKVSSATSQPCEGHLYINLAMTFQGLKRIGVPEDELRLFPEEFRQGMEKRARLLGDVYENHPDHWILPERYRSGSQSAKGEVQLSMVDVVIQVRSTQYSFAKMQEILDTASDPLHTKMTNWINDNGLRLLHVQALERRETGLFGFRDGVSQPTLAAKSHSRWSDQVSPGEILLGYPTDRDQHFPNHVPVHPLLHNGTYLVIRKIRQHVDALNEFLQDQQAQLGERYTPDQLKAKLMGRMPGENATPLVNPLPSNGSNDFDFSADPEGRLCPLHSHIRRANPRTLKLNDPVPRIVRRGLSYGPIKASPGEPEPDHGLMFMAYNSSIANQFEVIQRWLSGGNSAGGYSGVGDPMLSIPQDGERRTFRCMMGDQVMRFDLDPPDRIRLITRLQWGLYLFVPSMDVIKSGFDFSKPHTSVDEKETAAPTTDKQQKKLREEILLARKAYEEAESKLTPIVKNAMLTHVDPEKLGTDIVEVVGGVTNALAQGWLWKSLLEDPIANTIGVTKAVWSYVRNNKGNLAITFASIENEVVTPGRGFLVGDYELMKAVLQDDKTFVVNGTKHGLNDSYMHRMTSSIGPIYLGLDSGKQYDAESTFINAEIGKISRTKAYGMARFVTQQVIGGIVAAKGKPCTLPIIGIVDQVLAALCEQWFDVPDNVHVKRGGQPLSVNDTSVHCPFHYTAPSRYFFLPLPEPYLAAAGQNVGKRLTAAVRDIVDEWRSGKRSPQGTLSAPINKAITDADQLARTLVGVMMGFLPTTLGNILGIFRHWLESAEFWRVQDQYLHLFDPASEKTLPEKPAEAFNLSWFRFLDEEVRNAMQHNPSPEMIWRMAIRDFVVKKGKIAFRKGDRIILSSYSSVCSAPKKGNAPDVFPVFGGDRAAPESRPVHACPGYEMAMGVLMGICAAVLEAGTLRPTAIPLTLELHA